MTAGRKQRVAILGGGMAALTAAFELTEQDKERKRYDITIYTHGWRLGGKGAVGRQRDQRKRATEHGLHVLAGFYDNAFDMIRRCYAALPAPPFGSWQDAFIELDHWTLMEKDGENWQPWRLSFPSNALTPGAPASGLALIDFIIFLLTSAENLFIRAALPEDVKNTLVTPRSAEDQRETPPLTLARTRVEAMPRQPPHITDDHRDAVLAAIDRSILLLTGRQPSNEKPRPATAVERVEGADPVHPLGRSLERRTRTLLELLLVIARGLVQENVFFGGFDRLDREEWSAWMAAHGCSDETLDSAIVRGCYNYVFGFFDGERNVGAGTGTRCLMRLLLGAKGHLFYVPRATLGEVIFAPLYRVLAGRRVKFAFFHRVKSLHLSPDRKTIERIRLGVQAHPKKPRYHPLLPLRGDDGLWSWPSSPDHDQLKEGDRLKRGEELEGGGFDLESDWTAWEGAGEKVLERDTHFDVVILAIGLGAFRYICRELMELPAWDAMIKNVKTTATVALQLWPRQTTAELGWPDSETLLAAFADPLNTWGDMSHLLALEAGPAGRAGNPGSLAYFVGNFADEEQAPAPGTDRSFLERQRQRAARDVGQWMRADLGHLWRYLRAAADGIERYLRVNVSSSDRYVLSVAGSLESRMTADGSGIDNLFLAGDWVRTGLNAGCLEAAVMSGRQAARAITGADMTVWGEEDFAGLNFTSTVLPAIGVLRALGRLITAGVGMLDACCVIHWASRDFVQAKLPDGMKLRELSPIPGVAAKGEQHPVILVFGRQSGVRPGFAPFGGLAYYEFAEIIPYVTLGNTVVPGPFSYMPCLLLDELAPVILGVNLYGYKKQLARFRVHADSMEIRSDLGEIALEFKNDGPAGTFADFAPRLRKIRPMMEQTGVAYTAQGTRLFSFTDHHLDGAMIQPVHASVRIGRPFLEDGREPREFVSIRAKEFGAFRLTTQWTLTLPVADSSPAGQASPPNSRVFHQGLIGVLRNLGF